MIIELPYPPSVNNMYRSVKGRLILSTEGRTYKAEVGYVVNQLDMEPLDGDVEVNVQVYRPRKAGDLDNRLKATLDALEGVAYHNDRQIKRIIAERFDDKANPRVVVKIKVIE